MIPIWSRLKSYLDRRCARWIACWIALPAAAANITNPAAAAINVALNVDTSAVRAVMPDIGIGLHTSVYANQFDEPELPGLLADSGVQMLRYPGGNYASIYHWTSHIATGGYAASASHFGNFVDLLLDGSGATGMVTVNYGSSHQHTMGGQPKEAAAWVAYANGDASLYGTPNDLVLGVDAEGNDWRTVGYWARLRGMTPAQTPDNQYDRLAIDHDQPIGIQYWEIGNEINGNGYYSDIDANWNWQTDLHAPPGSVRGNNPLLSPTAYGQNFVEFASAMKAVDPTIKIGAVLVGPGGVGDLPANPARDWDRNVLLQAGDVMDFGIYHYYISNNGIDPVLNGTDNLVGIFAALRNRIDTYVGAGASDNIELHMTEFGYFNPVTTPSIDGVFAANTYATALEEGVQSVHWLEMSKNSFLGDTNNQTPGPAYYGIQLFSQIAEAGSSFVTTTDSSTGNNDVETHATVMPDGSVGLLIANLASVASSDANVTVQIDGVALAGSGTSWLYGVNQTTPLRTDLASGLGNSFTITVPFRSVMAVRIEPAPVPKLAGDYNEDGVVDAADFTVWRDSFGGTSLMNETVTLGIVDDADYDAWKANFGATASGELASPAVPEPSTWSLALVVLGCLGHRPRNSQSSWGVAPATR